MTPTHRGQRRREGAHRAPFDSWLARRLACSCRPRAVPPTSQRVPSSRAGELGRSTLLAIRLCRLRLCRRRRATSELGQKLLVQQDEGQPRGTEGAPRPERVRGAKPAGRRPCGQLANTSTYYERAPLGRALLFAIGPLERRPETMNSSGLEPPAGFGRRRAGRRAQSKPTGIGDNDDGRRL
jgi:hypothetical protein